MTCTKQELCIHEKYCQRHIGQNFDNCILFSRNDKPMINEEWLHILNTEQLAEFILMISEHMYDLGFNPMDKSINMSEKHFAIIKWLKEVHNDK